MTEQTVHVGTITSTSNSVVNVDVAGEQVQVPLSELGAPNTPVQTGVEVAVPVPMDAPDLAPDDPSDLDAGLIYRLADIEIRAVRAGEIRTDDGVYKADLIRVVLLDESMPRLTRGGHLLAAGQRRKIFYSLNIATGERWIAAVLGPEGPP